ncbi:hypothetical protein GWN26_04225 [Candidatus Saccharibacteria bacterium]|nr:hypothetical protein [Candidatus Saccharibacteria bacterium]NIW78686.1 hypothetical protein [Calditrichia bacterium]
MIKYQRIEQILWGSLIAWSIIGIFLTICYYFWELSPIAMWLSWLPLVILGFIFVPVPMYIDQYTSKNTLATKIMLSILFVGLGVIFYFAFLGLWQSGTLEAIRSPWILVPKIFFTLCFVLCLGAMAWLIKTRSQKGSWLILGAITFLFLSVALFVYKIGYGFDPFIHQATERYLAEHGTITPKPFYYIGQYSWITFCHFFSHLGINLLDKILLPAMAAAFLPAAIFTGLSQGFSIRNRFAKLGALLFLAIPFGSMIVTTPQGLANLFALIIIFLSLSYLKNQTPPLYFLMILGAMCLAIHPLTGIPVAIYLLILLLLKIRSRVAKITLVSITAVLGAFSLPLVFIINSLVSGTGVNVTTAILQSPGVLLNKLRLPELYIDSHFSSIIDFVYIYGKNLIWLIPIVAVITLIFKAQKITKLFWIPAMMFLVLIVNYFFLQNTVEFSFLISYEQGAYADRVLSLAQFFIYPFFILGILWWVEKTWQTNWSWRIVLSLFLSGIIISSLYLSYPRHDALEISKGINVASSDIAAVQWIERDAPDDEFIVLANQTVSAAALHEYGFKKYFNDKFYYPIPTGGELYDYYLKMSYESPSSLTMNQAMDLVGVDYAYFILNDYWWNAEKVIEDAKLQTNTWHEIDDGKIYIFKYTK